MAVVDAHGNEIVPRGIWAKIPWSTVAGWLVAILVALGGWYERFIDMERGRGEDRQMIERLQTKVEAMQVDLQSLRTEVRVLTNTIQLEREERQRNGRR